MDYPYAVNEIKLRRAIAECGPEATDEAIKEKYIALGGLVRADFIEEVPEVVTETTEEKPKKTTKKAKK